MAEQPSIRPGEWITIGKRDCVVSQIYDSSYSFGDIEVVFDKDKPTNHDAIWEGEKWNFAPSSDFGGYAERNPKLEEYVRILKKGRY